MINAVIKRKNFTTIGLGLDRPGIVPAIVLIQFIILFPLWFELPLWITGVSAGILILRYATYHFQVKLPSWFILLLVLTSIVGVYLQFKRISGRDAGVGLIVLMYGFKLLEAKTYRDAALILFISFFILVMSFLYNESIVMGFYLIAAIMAILMGLIALNNLKGIAGIKNVGKISGVALLQSLPIMIALFFLFPRLPGPLWGMPDSSRAQTGISDSMSPGDITSLGTNDEPVFRVKFMDKTPVPNDMYWRGLVFSNFDGFTWRQGRRSPLSDNVAVPSITTYEYEVQLEPHKQYWIFGLEQIGSLINDVSLYSDQTLRSNTKVSSRIQYRTKARRYNYQDIELEPWDRNMNLSLPGVGNDKSRDWANQQRKNSINDREFIKKVLTYIYQQEYFYTLTPQIVEDENTIDGFWFGTREGFCGHYAGAFVFLMRASGIPARVVTGYQGGEYNPYGDYYLIRQSDAHAWTEVWLEDDGWVRVDPTAAINPERVDLGLASQLNARDSWLSDKISSIVLPSGWLEKIKLRWDSVQNFWNETLMGYDQDLQNDWLARLGIKKEQWRYLGYGLIVSIMLFGAIFGLFILRKVGKKDIVEKFYNRLLIKINKLGTETYTHEGPMDLLARVKKENPLLANKIMTPLKMYIKLRYKKEITDSDKKKVLIGNFKKYVNQI